MSILVTFSVTVPAVKVGLFTSCNFTLYWGDLATPWMASRLHPLAHPPFRTHSFSVS
ncbi:hypothetical protein L228DRAFT_246323 [Xylona heveae TC161]|uniref:Uncharacterized protein n=1 Tax=Xylona heveae (strain CBS 132557 / TC161) TaxID=1328760 RepID=A0A165HHV8_XYLHT|nr:hypothetical protein L228DRAFT_246323 [Xylona heveae TC161]KZF23541.1 hypothetical protein L228DRAFT_246323 [Xylona heveae TC161]